MPNLTMVATDSHKVGTQSYRNSHLLGAEDFGATQGAVLPLRIPRFVRGNWDGTGKVADEKGEEDS